MIRQSVPSSLVGIAALLLLSGCASNEIKEENADLKQQVEQLQTRNQQEAQLRQDYADKLQASQNLSTTEKARARAEVAALRKDLRQALEVNEVNIQRLANLTVIDIQHSVLFKSGQAELSQEGKAVVSEIAEVFKEYPGFHMRIEGHTDDQPIHAKLKARYASNWELSGARAATVVKYMIYALGVPGENLSIAGYADYRPIAENNTDAGRAQNRRIRAVLFRG